MIDIKELRAGCHLLLSNRRVKVANIDSLNNLIGIEEYYYVAKDGIKYCIANEPKDLSPIPITEELLKELGFVPTYDEGVELWNKQIIPKECNNPLISKYGVNLRVYRYCNGWQVETNPSNGLQVNYLHEMELIVYMITKQELI